MLVRVPLLLGVIVAVGFAPAPFPKRSQRVESRATLERMQGWWAIIDETISGQPGRNARTSNLRLLVKGDTLTYYLGDSPADGWTITVNDGTRPPELDKMSLRARKGTKPSYLGRVAVQGDELTVCWCSGSERPRDLSGTRGVAIRFLRERK